MIADRRRTSPPAAIRRRQDAADLLRDIVNSLNLGAVTSKKGRGVMTVKDFMTSDVKSCNADTDLATVAKIMWDCDCGTVPVVNEERHVIGMITDRDICIATATRSTLPASIRVRDVISGEVHACSREDDVRAVLHLMKEQRVRRLPVLDQQQRLVGIISMNDLVARAECRRGADVPGDQFLETLKSICAHPRTAVAA